MSDTIETPRHVIHAGLPPPVPTDYLSEVDLEHARWSGIGALVRLLSRDERIVPGYVHDPDWTMKDLVAHLGVWLAEAATELTNVAANAYQPRDLDVDMRNADTLAAWRDEPWDVVWGHAVGARANMLQRWFSLRASSDPADLWVRKAGAEHYAEHVPRLRAWVVELIDVRTRPPSDEWDS